MTDDLKILLELAWQYKEISEKPIYGELRALWRSHNSLIKGRVPVIVLCGPWDAMGSEILTTDKLLSSDAFYKKVEYELRYGIFMDYINDDSIVEPLIKLRPVFGCAGWGVRLQHKRTEGSETYQILPAVAGEDDLQKLISPSHLINEKETQKNYEMAMEAIGDILPVIIDKSPYYVSLAGDISYWLGQLAGIEQIMLNVYDQPEFMHKLLAHLRDGIKKTHQEALKAGHWKSVSGQNQSMTYSQELPDPSCDGESLPISKIWGFFAAQEFALISPEMHKEFLLDYQMPLMEQFGLIAYGCCEDLTNKISMLRQIPNLRRIAVSPFANAKSSAEQIERDYVISYRPNPAVLAETNWSPKNSALAIQNEVNQLKDSIYDITMKDVTTVRGEPSRLADWVKAVKEIL